jgi:hypothetical protein
VKVIDKIFWQSTFVLSFLVSHTTQSWYFSIHRYTPISILTTT